MIVIKNIKIPETCVKCQFLHYTYFGEEVCSLDVANKLEKDKRSDDCPLVEVNLDEMIEDENLGEDFDNGFNVAIHMIKDMVDE